ncbi:MAG: BrnA antitoxin family protein [Pseudomonadota bacterium]
MKKKSQSNQWRQVKNPQIFSKDDVQLRNVKVDVHMKIDADLIEYFRELANKMGKGYQTLLNDHLRQSVFEERNLEERVEKIEKALHAVGVQK